MMELFIDRLAALIWNYPIVTLCLAVGALLTLRLRFVQWRHIPHTIALVSGKYNDTMTGKKGVSPFEALATALSGTIGLGSITGVALAIGIGGPGAIFWMWVVGFLGMATKYAEVAMSVFHREVNEETGEVRGGPMYYIPKSLGKNWKWLGVIYGLFIGLSAFGSANLFQANQAARALHQSFDIPMPALSVGIAALVGVVIFGGLKRISSVSTRLVPFMCATYLGSALIICLLNITHIPSVIATIFTDAFSGNAVAGGLIGSMVIAGVRRAVFSSESGLGTAPTVHATSKAHPIQQALVATIEPFVNTILICTATAFVIVLSGNFGSEIFQKTSHHEINFLPENKQQINLAPNWQIASENIPVSAEKLRSFRAGEYALEYDNNKTRNTSITLPEVTITNEDGIRFSYFKETGNMAIRLLSPTGKEIVKLETTEDGEILQIDPKTNTLTNIVDIRGQLRQGKWESLVIGFTPELKEQGLTSIALKFSPKGKNVHWYLDRIQPVSQLEGMELTVKSFDTFFQGFGSVFVTLTVLLFAFTTIIAWYYYGETGMHYVFGNKVILPYRILSVFAAFLGTFYKWPTAWHLSDILIGSAAIVNMIFLLMMSGKISAWTKDYFRNLKNEETFLN